MILLTQNITVYKKEDLFIHEQSPEISYYKDNSRSPNVPCIQPRLVDSVSWTRWFFGVVMSLFDNYTSWQYLHLLGISYDEQNIREYVKFLRLSLPWRTAKTTDDASPSMLCGHKIPEARAFCSFESTLLFTIISNSFWAKTPLKQASACTNTPNTSL